MKDSDMEANAQLSSHTQSKSFIQNWIEEKNSRKSLEFPDKKIGVQGNMRMEIEEV